MMGGVKGDEHCHRIVMILTPNTHEVVPKLSWKKADEMACASSVLMSFFFKLTGRGCLCTTRRNPDQSSLEAAATNLPVSLTF